MFPEMWSGVPTGTSAVLDMTAEFLPLLLGLYGLLVVSLGGLVLRSLAPRTERTVRPMDKRVMPTAVAPEVPKLHNCLFCSFLRVQRSGGCGCSSLPADALTSLRCAFHSLPQRQHAGFSLAHELIDLALGGLGK